MDMCLQDAWNEEQLSTIRKNMLLSMRLQSDFADKLDEDEDEESTTATEMDPTTMHPPKQPEDEDEEEEDWEHSMFYRIRITPFVRKKTNRSICTPGFALKMVNYPPL